MGCPCSSGPTLKFGWVLTINCPIGELTIGSHMFAVLGDLIEDNGVHFGHRFLVVGQLRLDGVEDLLGLYGNVLFDVLGLLGFDGSLEFGSFTVGFLKC